MNTNAMNGKDRVLAGRYRLLERIGRGGMGSVWRAQDELLGRVVAVKEILIPPELSDADRSVACERAQREARVAALLDHPSIITVHDVLVEDGRPWIVMELVQGPSLDQVIRDHGPLPYVSVARIGAEVLVALLAAHEQGVLHRDVKPGNVLLADDGRVILTDFGIAALDGAPALTRTGAFVGSPGFMAPERLQERPVGPASDLWSLAATLYTAVEGRAPFERGTPMATLGAVLTEEAPPPSRAGQLAPLLWHLLRPAPEDRLPAAQAEEVLRRIAAGGPCGLVPGVPAPPPDGRPVPPAVPPAGLPAGPAAGPQTGPQAGGVPATGPSASEPPRRGPLLAALGGAVALVVMIGLGVVFWPGGSSPGSAGSGGPAARSGPANAGSTPGAGTSTGTGTPGTSPGPESAGGTAPGATKIDFCKLIGTSEARALVPGSTPRLDTEHTPPPCVWTSRPRRRGLSLRPASPQTTATATAAHSTFVYLRNVRVDGRGGRHVWGWDEVGVRHAFGRQGAVRTVRGVGDEAFGYEVRGTTTTVDKSYVVLRSGSSVVEVEFVFERGTATSADTEQVARRAARAVPGTS